MTEAIGPEPDGDDYSVTDALGVLGQLKQQRARVLEQAHTDLRVPRWGEPGTNTPEIFVRYKPVDHRIIRKAAEASEKRSDKKAAAEMRANIDVLIAGCVGVYAIVDDHPYSLRIGDPRGEWTTFDEDLAGNLGCGNSATDVIRALYIADGDILSAANAVAEFSGYKEAEADERTSGE